MLHLSGNLLQRCLMELVLHQVGSHQALLHISLVTVLDSLNEVRTIDKELGDTARVHDSIECLIQVALPIIHGEVGRIGPRMEVLGGIWAYMSFNLSEYWGERLFSPT